MQTRVVFEMDEPTPEGDAVLISLTASIRKFCPDVQAAIFPRYNVDLSHCRMSEGIVNTAEIAQIEINKHPAFDMCIYISPRVVKAEKRLIPATIFVIRTREKLLAARVQVIHEKKIRPLVQKMIGPEVGLAHEQLFGTTRPDAEENAFGDTIAVAIHNSYMLAHTFLNTHMGTA